MRAGRVLVLLLFLVGVVGVLITDEAIYPRLLYLSILVLLVAFLWTRLALAGIRVHRHARLQKASAGDVFEEHFEIRNASPFLAPNIEVINESRLPAASGSRMLTRIGGTRSVTYLARTYLTHRGRYTLGPTLVTGYDPFGLFRASRRFPSEETVVILPVIYEIASFPAAPGILPGGQAIRKKSADVTPHASSVREYSPGDPLKSIHWPTTARRGKVMVKEFEQDPQAEVWIFLDVQDGAHYNQPYTPPALEASQLLYRRVPRFVLPPSTLEYAVSAAATLSHYFINQKRAVGLVAAGHIPTFISAERSDRQEAKTLETLAYLEDDGRLSLAESVTMQAPQLSAGSTAILVTANVRPELLTATEDLQRRGLHPIVLLLDPETFGGPPGADALQKSLLSRGIPICRVRCGDDLTQTLSAFAPARGAISWQRIQSPQLT
ncbi:MAG: DUF58 domain-containing protein [Chloroflexi bacterium]|nr:DUF58 domain-containing protein [Chloroflexota bacterium]